MSGYPDSHAMSATAAASTARIATRNIAKPHGPAASFEQNAQRVGESPSTSWSWPPMNEPTA